MVAARDGGGDPVGNPALELAIRKAKEASMPKDNIERAIAKGTGEGGEAEAIEAVLYEGYGPGGVALLVEALTENRNRTGAEVRHAFAKNGGSLGEPGSVAYLFDKKGTIVVDATRYSEDDLMPAVEAGAEDISVDDDVFEVITEPADFTAVRHALEEAGVEIDSAEIAYRPRRSCPSTRSHAGTLMRLIDSLEEQRRRRSACTPTSTRRRRAGACRGLTCAHALWLGRNAASKQSLRLEPAPGRAGGLMPCPVWPLCCARAAALDRVLCLRTRFRVIQSGARSPNI